MIPKIIHYCWLSDNPYPSSISVCIESWHRHLPDYEFVLWNRERFDINKSLWVKQAYESQKYAFAADYIRLYALYNFGGIYLDSDVLVYTSFDDLLNLPYFIGRDFMGAFEPAVLGCEKGTQWIKHVLDYYTDKCFVNDDGSFNIQTLPMVFFDRLFPKYNFKSISSRFEFEHTPNTIMLFDRWFFNSRDNVDVVRTKKSYCSHKFASSWCNGYTKNLLRNLLPRKWMNMLVYPYYQFFRRATIQNYDPIYMQSLRK